MLMMLPAVEACVVLYITPASTHLRQAGIFGVAPGTSAKTNEAALKAASSNSIFTNVAMDPNYNPWWDGLTPTPPPGTVSWLRKPW